MELANGIAIVGGVAAAVYIVETAGKYGYALYKKSSVAATTSKKRTL